MMAMQWRVLVYPRVLRYDKNINGYAAAVDIRIRYPC